MNKDYPLDHYQPDDVHFEDEWLEKANQFYNNNHNPKGYSGNKKPKNTDLLTATEADIARIREQDLRKAT